MSTLKPACKGLNVILSIDGKPLGGQQDAQLVRSMTPINITNRIDDEWSNSIAGIKSWSINCAGMHIKDSVSFEILENAFNTGSPIEVVLKGNEHEYKGRALITSFPVSAPYSSTCIYNLGLTGCGALE